MKVVDSNVIMKITTPNKNIMIDIETLGSDPRASPIIQIGACKFDNEFNILDTFDGYSSAEEGCQPEESSMKFWKETDPELLEKILEEGHQTQIKTVLEDLGKWMPNKSYTWAWPITFDLQFIRVKAYKHNCNKLLNKMHPSRSIDCRSWLFGIARDAIENFTNIEYPEFEGRRHNALDDAINQVKD